MPLFPAQQLLWLQDRLNRRTFLSGSAASLGLAALSSLIGSASGAEKAKPALGLPGLPHHKPKAKRVIYLFQSGAPSQMDLFDPKPGLEKFRGQDLPASIRMGQRLTGMTAGQGKHPVAPSIFKFAKHGQSGQPFCELLPQTAKWADKIAFVKSMQTNAINHDPAITFFQTGQEIAGRPSIGSWLSYGLGSENQDLPAYVVMTSQGSGRPADQPLYDRLWGSGFIPTKHQGVKLRNQGDPVLYLSDPPGIDRGMRREMLDELGELNKLKLGKTGDPEIATRISQYEMAVRMQASVPELTDLSKEPAKTLEAYGPDVKRPGSYAYNCLLARRLSERGVRFVQLFHMGWDHHGGLPAALRGQCRDTDRPTAALLTDLEARGLLDDTLIVWGGEFGRTVYSQGALSATDYGRDHHPKCFSVWLAGGGIKGGVSHGETDDYGYNVTRDPVQVRDLHATVLHLLGIEHEKLTYKFQGLDAKLTGVEASRVLKEIIA